jgi:hypothetical protein
MQTTVAPAHRPTLFPLRSYRGVGLHRVYAARRRSDPHESGALEIAGDAFVKKVAVTMTTDAAFDGIDVAVKEIGQSDCFDFHAVLQRKRPDESGLLKSDSAVCAATARRR